jgi:DNA-binding MarR family transcriptional regulator
MLNNKLSVDAHIVGMLLVTARALEKVGDAIFSRYGITLSMYELLMLIAVKVDTTTRMANMSQITLASITHKTKILEEKDYIRRVMDRKDKRIWYFSLTPNGKKLLETVSKVYDKVTMPLFAQLSEKEKQQIVAFLTGTEEHMRIALENRAQMLEHIDKMLQEPNPRPDASGKRV